MAMTDSEPATMTEPRAELVSTVNRQIALRDITMSVPGTIEVSVVLHLDGTELQTVQVTQEQTRTGGTRVVFTLPVTDRTSTE